MKPLSTGCERQPVRSLFVRRFPADAAQDKFFTQLRSSADGFAVIAEFFGRGILNQAAASS